MFIKRCYQYAHVYFSFLQFGDDEFRCEFRDRQLYQGILPDEFLDEQGQQVRGQGGDDTHFEQPGDDPFFLLHNFFDHTFFAQDLSCLLKDGGAGFGGYNRLFGAVEYFKPQFLLQFLYLHAQGGLGDETLAGRFGKMPGVVNGHDIGQLGKCHANRFYL